MRISDRVANASWLRLGILFAALMAYSAWAFRDGGAFQSALTAAGGRLPEMTPGFPQGLAVETFTAMQGHIAKYTLFQAIDIPYAILNMLVFSSAIALGLRRFKLATHPVRYALFLPSMYLLAEFIENPLLIVLANGEPGEPAGVVFLQQLATNVKWGAITGAIAAAVIALLATLTAMIMGVVRKR